MSSEPRRVAVTGVGVVSCLGVGCRQVLDALRAGRSGVRLLPDRRELGFRSALSGVIDPFTPRHPLSRKERKSMPLFAEWAFEAVQEAVEMSGLPRETIASPRTGLVFGNDSVAEPAHRQAQLMAARGTTAALHSGMVFQSMNSCMSMNLNTLLGTQGASWTLSGACASGGHAVGQAADLIALGRQDRVICGGGQEITWESVCSFDALGAFSIREDDPEAASRPFDADRDGLVPSGGAAALVLEEMDGARQRGATILGEVLGYAFSSDGGHIAVPSGDGLARCMAEVLERAQVGPASIDYVSAHGTSTPVGDAVEADAIHRIFGSARPWISSTKSMTGHEMWMSGASQVIYSLISAHEGFIPGNLNFERPDDRTRGLKIAPETVTETPELILCNSAGFGGTNSCIVLHATT